MPTGQLSAQLIADAVAEGEREAAAAAEAPDIGLERLRDERAALIQLCLYALDRARSGGVVERLEAGLAGVGVSAMRPDGEPFDPASHEAGGTVSTADSSLDGVVAETEVVGFSDGGTLLRAPIVTVYKLRDGSPA
ncbi:MAG: nucleotide exchange factor GrpE [Actinophytocola sp.]|nr:nucleotide exchange factor GrpE [Actinophytocola sp.]